MTIQTAVPMEIDGDDVVPMDLDPTQTSIDPMVTDPTSPARPMEVDRSPARPVPMLISPQIIRTEPRRHLSVEQSTIRNLMGRFTEISQQTKRGRAESVESLLAHEKKPKATTVPAQNENDNPNLAPELKQAPLRQRRNAIAPHDMAAAIALLNTAKDSSQANSPQRPRQ